MIINIKKRLKAINNIINVSDDDNELNIIIDIDGNGKSLLKNKRTGVIKELNDKDIDNLYKQGQLSNKDIIVKIVD